MNARSLLSSASLVNYGVATAVTAVGGGLLLLVFNACGFDPPAKNTSDGGGTEGVVKCEAPPGKLPEPNCDNSDNKCTETGCPIDPSCGEATTCLPLAKNGGGAVLDFRIRRLNVAAPPTLAEAFVQNSVVTKNVDLKAKQCGELGNGAFNWLFQIDKDKNTIRTGGAPPSTDVFGLGYCFYDHSTKEGIVVKPAETTIKFDGDTFSTAVPIAKLNVPIFLGGNVDNAIVLPLTDATVTKTTISAGGDCIGAFEPKALTSDCQDDPSSCAKWKTAGAIGGYITLEEADAVPVKDLNESLCVLLTKATKQGPEGKCPRDAAGALPKGDFCAATKSGGGCQDSYWLAATFAASAVKIHDGGAVAECKSGGGPGPDAGNDAAPDAAADAQAD
jgi:hypothetical protein